MVDVLISFIMLLMLLLIDTLLPAAAAGPAEIRVSYGTNISKHINDELLHPEYYIHNCISCTKNKVCNLIDESKLMKKKTSVRVTDSNLKLNRLLEHKIDFGNALTILMC